MRFETPPDLPRRELSEPPRLVWEYGLLFLVVTVLRAAGVRKGGEVRYRRLTMKYRVVRGDEAVVLVTNRTDPETLRPVAYTVMRQGCNCPDFGFKGRERTCKHFEAVRELRLWDGPAAGGAGN